MNDELMKKLVDRFLLWPLPVSVCSDLCVTFHGRTDRIGTNLLTAIEARAMLEFVLEPVRSAEAIKRLTVIDQELDASSPAATAVAPKDDDAD